MENLDFEQLKSQMAALEKKIADQEIVNERLLRESMKDKMAWIKRYVWLEIIAVPFAVVLWAGFCVFAKLPLWFVLVMLAGCVVDVWLDWKVNVTPLKDNDFDRQNLIETAEKLRRMKRQRAIQTVAGVVAVLLFSAAVFVAVYLRNFRGADLLGNPSPMNGALVGGCVGLAVGSIVGVVCVAKIFRKMQRSNDEIIRQIEELTEN